MSALGILGHAVEAYLDERRNLGFRMNGSELKRFARYVDKHNYEGPITADIQIAYSGVS